MAIEALTQAYGWVDIQNEELLYKEEIIANLYEQIAQLQEQLERTEEALEDISMLYELERDVPEE